MANFLFLFPFYIGLNASTNFKKPFSSIEVKSYLFRMDRFLIALLSISSFAIALFAFAEGEVAIILGAVILVVLIVLDSRRIYRGNREPSDDI